MFRLPTSMRATLRLLRPLIITFINYLGTDGPLRLYGRRTNIDILELVFSHLPSGNDLASSIIFCRCHTKIVRNSTISAKPGQEAHRQVHVVRLSESHVDASGKGHSTFCCDTEPPGPGQTCLKYQ